MTDLRKAAEMALEALEIVYGKGKRCEAAIKELRQALAQPDLARVGEVGVWGNSQALAESANSTMDFVEPKASFQTEQEPVAWMHNFIEGTVITHEPADIDRHPDRWTPLYTAPPKREWVGLTDEDLEPMCNDWRIIFGPYVHDFAKAIEAKLKEKNA